MCFRSQSKFNSHFSDVWSELLLSFSIVTNFNAICDRSVGSDTIPSIHGLRAISMAWVILGMYLIAAPYTAWNCECAVKSFRRL